MAMGAHYRSCYCSSNTTRIQTPFSLPYRSPLLGSRPNKSISFSPNPRFQFQQRNRFASAISAVAPVKVVDSGTSPVKFTYLEGNSWLWDLGGVNVLVDPVLVGNLDFGMPLLYDAARKYLKSFRLEDLPELDCLLITQSLDDHCHVKTLKPLSQMFPGLRVVATPNAQAILNPLFSNISYIEPGESSELEGKNGARIKIRATSGPVLGPPWQQPENGYIVSSAESHLSLYHEPHCVYNSPLLGKDQADVVITPITKQLLPSFTLVSGQEDAVQLAKLLKAKFVVPMNNGNLESKGIISRLISSVGSVESFKELLSKEVPDAQVLEPTPGVPLEVPVLPYVA